MKWNFREEGHKLFIKCFRTFKNFLHIKILCHIYADIIYDLNVGELDIYCKEW